MGAMAVTVKLVNDGETRVVAVVVHAGDIDEIIEAEVFFGDRADFGDTAGISDSQRDLATELDGLGDEIAEPGLELIGEFEGVHSRIDICALSRDFLLSREDGFA